VRFTPSFNPQEILNKLFRGELSAADLQRAIFIDTLHGQGLMRRLAEVLRPRSVDRLSLEFGKKVFGVFVDFGLEAEFFKGQEMVEFDSPKHFFSPIALRALTREYSVHPPSPQEGERLADNLIRAVGDPKIAAELSLVTEALSLLSVIAPPGHKGALDFVERCYQKLNIELRSGRSPNPELALAFQLALTKIAPGLSAEKGFLHRLSPILYDREDQSAPNNERLPAILDWMWINTDSDRPQGQFVDEAYLIAKAENSSDKEIAEKLSYLVISSDAAGYFPAYKLVPLLNYISGHLPEGHPEFSQFIFENAFYILRKLFSKRGGEYLREFMAPMMINIMRKTLAAGDRRLLEFLYLIFDLNSPSLEASFCQLLYEKGFNNADEIVKKAGQITELQRQTIETTYALLEGGFFRKYRVPERDEPGFSDQDLQMGFDFIERLRQACLNIHDPAGQASFRFLYHTARPIVKAAMARYSAANGDIDLNDQALKVVAVIEQLEILANSPGEKNYHDLQNFGEDLALFKETKERIFKKPPIHDFPEHLAVMSDPSVWVEKAPAWFCDYMVKAFKHTQDPRLAGNFDFRQRTDRAEQKAALSGQNQIGPEAGNPKGKRRVIARLSDKFEGPHAYLLTNLGDTFDPKTCSWHCQQPLENERIGGSSFGKTVRVTAEIDPFQEDTVRLPRNLYSKMGSVSLSRQVDSPTLVYVDGIVPRVVFSADKMVAGEEPVEIGYALQMIEPYLGIPGMTDFPSGIRSYFAPRYYEALTRPTMKFEHLPLEAQQMLNEVRQLNLRSAIRKIVAFVHQRYQYLDDLNQTPEYKDFIARKGKYKGENELFDFAHKLGDEKYLGKGICIQLANILCEYLRQAGIPARIAAGYLAKGKEITDKDAHAWVVVEIPNDYGQVVYIPLEATAVGTPIRKGAADLQPLEIPAQLLPVNVALSAAQLANIPKHLTGSPEDWEMVMEILGITAYSGLKEAGALADYIHHRYRVMQQRPDSRTARTVDRDSVLTEIPLFARPEIAGHYLKVIESGRLSAPSEGTKNLLLSIYQAIRPQTPSLTL
jgi:transglutaminase-like putative cysteine protease